MKYGRRWRMSKFGISAAAAPGYLIQEFFFGFVAVAKTEQPKCSRQIIRKLIRQGFAQAFFSPAIQIQAKRTQNCLSPPLWQQPVWAGGRSVESVGNSRSNQLHWLASWLSPLVDFFAR